MVSKDYAGKELDLFAEAWNWKSYYSSFLRPYLEGNVLEVGAGIGGATIFLCDGSQDSWVCLEPDAKLAKRIKLKIKNIDLFIFDLLLFKKCFISSSHLRDILEVVFLIFSLHPKSIFANPDLS